MITGESSDAVAWYARLEDGKILPVAGGWLNQTAVYAQAMDTIRAASSQARQKR